VIERLSDCPAGSLQKKEKCNRAVRSAKKKGGSAALFSS
jgi:hypothetical protein